MRRSVLLLAVPFALLMLLPPVAAQEQEEPGGFHGFGSFQTHAQGQVAELTGYLSTFREDNRLVGALSEINGPPANSRNIAAFVQRGEGATFVYGVIGGPGGARGTLPDPPPFEANAYYPTDPPEMTVNGPVTSGAEGQVVDGYFHAKATDTPTGRAEAMVTKLHQEDAFTVEAATVVSHTEPGDGGVWAESVSVLKGVAAGPLLIETLVSRAMAFVPAAGGEPTGVASTVVEGATVNGQPVQITAEGVVVGENSNPLGQEEINQAFAEAGFEQVRVLPSDSVASDEGQAILADAGAVEFVKQDEAFGASNPQGFSGGGFSIGGATARVSSVRCAPDCPSGLNLGVPPDPVPSDGDLTPVEPPAPPPAQPATAPAPEPYPVVDTGFADTGSDVYFDSGDFGGGVSVPSSGSSPGSGSSSTSAPPDVEYDTGPADQAAAPVVNQQSNLASSGMGPEEADWIRDLYLGLGVGAGVLLVGSRFAQALK